MAKIDLNRERGVRVTNKPSGGLDYNFGGVYAGINAQQKANDALAKGMNHVGRVLTGIYDDMAATRNRQETLAGETAYFDIQEQTNQKILQQILNVFTMERILIAAYALVYRVFLMLT